MTTTTQTKKSSMEATTVPAFGIEADHPRNADLLVQGVPECKLRSSIKPTKEVFDTEDGETITRPADAKMYDGLPSRIPGMQLHVNPGQGTYVVFDPLQDDEMMLERIKRVIDRQSAVTTSTKLRPAKTKEGKLNKDEMKTLIREMYNIVSNNHAKVVKGVLPDIVDIEDLPGDFLLNPSKRQQWHQPRYEKDLEEWENKLNRMSG